MEDERKVELVKEFYDIDITDDVNNFENVECNIYTETTADGYECYILTNDIKRLHVCEEI